MKNLVIVEEVQEDLVLPTLSKQYNENEKYEYEYEIDLRTVISFDLPDIYILNGYKEKIGNIEFMIETITGIDYISYLYITYLSNNNTLSEEDYLNIIKKLHNKVIHFNNLGEYSIHLNIHDLKFSTIIINKNNG